MLIPNRHLRTRVRLERAGAALFLSMSTLALAGCTITYEFDPLTVGDDDAGRAPEALSNSQFVRGVYVDVLGRAPDVYDFALLDAQGVEVAAFPIREQANLVAVLDGIGDPAPMRAIVTAGLLGSAEVTVPAKADVADPAELVAEQFRTLLGREPNAYESRAFVDAWETDEAVGPRAVVRAIVASREYQSR